MSTKDYFKIAIKSIFRERKNIFYIIIIVICTILALGSLVFSANFSNFIKTSYTKNIGFRTLFVMPKVELSDMGEKELLNIKHVNDVHSSKYNSRALISDLANNNLDGKVELLYGAIKALPNIVDGRTFNDNEKNVAICPINFYPDSSVYNLKMNDKYMLNGEKLLGKTFTVKYYTYKFTSDGDRIKDKELTHSFKIVGLYDNEQVMNFNNQCYIPDKDITEIIGEGAVSNSSEKSFFAFSVVVDNLSNVQSVINSATKLGFERISVKNNINADLVRIIQVSCNVLLALVLFTIILVTSSYIKKKILNERRIIGILRTCGYKRNTVKNIYLLETILTNIFSYFIGIIIFLIIYVALKNTVLHNFTYFGLTTTINIFSLLFSLIIIILIPTFITFYHINKKSKIDIANLIGSEE